MKHHNLACFESASVISFCFQIKVAHREQVGLQIELDDVKQVYICHCTVLGIYIF